MTNKEAYLAIIALTLLVSICFVPLVSSQDSTKASQATAQISPLQSGGDSFENISVSLTTPLHNATITDDFNVSFTYIPAINGTDKFYGASLVVNGSVVASNQTAITAYQNNTISYKFAENGTATWNIRLQNSTHTVTAPEDRNLTLSVYPSNFIAVTLKSPDNGTTISNDFNCSFVYYPTISGTDKFFGASLIVNGTLVASNTTAVTANTNNTIYYKFSQNGTYSWNIRLQNSTNNVSAPSDYNFTVAVYVAPTATPTPAPTATPTPAPTAHPATATPTPTPEPDNSVLSMWAIIIIVVFVICGVLVAVLVLLRRKSS